MIIACLGKGGSGKSTVATQLSLWRLKHDQSVLAIDADHNLDLSFNLKGGLLDENFPYLSEAMPDLLNFFALNKNKKYTEIFFKKIDQKFYFNATDQDPFSRKYSRQVKKNLWLMAAGVQNDQVLYGQSCSHVLSSPLKAYLPCLVLGPKVSVIVDEKAGADGVTTGVVTGFDAALIICEPSLHSLKTAQQICGLLDFYKTPFCFVANKAHSETDRAFMQDHLPQPPIAYLPEDEKIKKNPGQIIDSWSEVMEMIWIAASKLNRNNRLERSREKFIQNAVFLKRANT